jgi:uncharacterized protein (TIGR02677 family)
MQRRQATEEDGLMTHPRGDVQPLLKYATLPDAPLYRAIVDVFTEAAAGYASRLSPEDVHATLAARFADNDVESVPTTGALADRLDHLVTWGNLTRDNDTARANTLDGYHRTAYVFDLSPAGEAAAEALATLEDGLRRVGGLQRVALRQIDDLLDELVKLLAAPVPNGERIFAVCDDVHTRFKNLTSNATLFMQKVNRLLNSPVVDSNEFALFKADVIAYLNDFIGDLDTLSAQIRGRVAALERLDPAARTAGLAAGEAASGQLALDDAPDAVTWARLTEAHLAGLADWFRAGPDARIGAAVLYEKARDAILGIARLTERLRESSASSSSRSADLLALASMFSNAANDADAHMTWHAAFGLSSARHLGLVVPNEPVPSTTSWWEEASRVPVSRQLRAAGRTDYVRRARFVTDRSADKRALAERAREAQRQTAEAAAVLVGLGTFAISHVNDRLGGPLPHPVLKLLASLLYRAGRAIPRRDGARRATSVDGVLVITVNELPSGRAARLHATSGTWTLPDVLVCVERRRQVDQAERAAADVSFVDDLTNGSGARQSVPTQVLRDPS